MTTPPRRRRHPPLSTVHSTLSSSLTSIPRSETFKVLLDPQSPPRLSHSTSVAPQTRSMARLAAASRSKRSNENLNTGHSNKKGLSHPTLTKNLRSRGPLVETAMNVLEERRMNDWGKRKAAEDEGKPNKMVKLDHQAMARPAAGPRVLAQTPTQPIRTRTAMPASLQKAAVRARQASTQVVPPTPARDLLRQGMSDQTTSPTDSPPRDLVARPPTPPRMRERPSQPTETAHAVPSTPSTSTFTASTPRKPSVEIGQQETSKMPSSLRRMGLSKMPASLATPRRSDITSLSTPLQPALPEAHPSRLIEESSATLAPPTTPSLAPSPRKVFNASALRPQSIATSTTPNTTPSAITMKPTPSNRLTAPSPLSSRVAAASHIAKERQTTLPAMFARTPVKAVPAMPTIAKPVPSALEEKALEDVEMKDEALEIQGTDQAALSISAQTPAVVVVPADVEMTDLATSTPNSEASAMSGTLSDIPMRAVDTSAPTSAPTKTTFNDPAIVTRSIHTPSVSSSSVPTLRTSASTKMLSSMGPPSRIPRSSAASSNVTAKPGVVSSTVKKPSLGSLPERRPSTRPSLVNSASSSSSFVLDSQSTSSTPTVKRKPSYPSSLGSGPLARPTPRMVSNPVLPPRTISTPVPSTVDEELASRPGQAQQRSVSAPVPRARLSLSSSRREGMSNETSKSLAGLSEALDKLKMKRQDSASSSTPHASLTEPLKRPTAISFAATPAALRPSENRPSNLSASTSSTTTAGSTTTTKLLAASHRSRQSVNPADVSITSDGDGGAADRSIAALLCSTNGGGCLRGIVAFVDVRTSEGDDSSRVFIDILKGLGAKVLSRPTESCTHIIYKSGKPSTLSWFRRQEDPKPHIVGIKWVTESKKAGKRLEEEPFGVDVSEEDVFQKRRKSMEPKKLATQNANAAAHGVRQALLDIADARRRSLMYAPKISSPLKKPSVLGVDEN